MSDTKHSPVIPGQYPTPRTDLYIPPVDKKPKPLNNDTETATPTQPDMTKVINWTDRNDF